MAATPEAFPAPGLHPAWPGYTGGTTGGSSPRKHSQGLHPTSEPSQLPTVSSCEDMELVLPLMGRVGCGSTAPPIPHPAPSVPCGHGNPSTGAKFPLEQPRCQSWWEKGPWSCCPEASCPHSAGWSVPAGAGSALGVLEPAAPAAGMSGHQVGGHPAVAHLPSLSQGGRPWHLWLGHSCTPPGGLCPLQVPGRRAGWHQAAAGPGAPLALSPRHPLLPGSCDNLPSCASPKAPGWSPSSLWKTTGTKRSSPCQAASATQGPI